MVNATGRTAKKAAPAAKKPDEPKAERHVRTPLERAQAVYDRAKAASDKITTKLTAAEKEVATLKAEAAEAKVTLDWAANHPLLVKARKDAGEEPPAAAEPPAAGPESELDRGPAALQHFADGSEIVSTVPPGEGDDDDTDGDGDEGGAEMPAFDFDNPPSIPTPAANPFDQGSQTHVV